MTQYRTEEAQLSVVNLDRVIAAMAGFGIELERGDENIAGANLNGYVTTFAMIGPSVLIVRADYPTDSVTADGDPSWFLAANYLNNQEFNVKSCVVDRTEKLFVRTELEVLIAAGLSDDQLMDGLKDAVDHVLHAQQALKEIKDQLSGIQQPAAD